MARLSQVAPAVAGSAGPGRHERRRHGDSAGASGCASLEAIRIAANKIVRTPAASAATSSTAATRKRSRRSSQPEWSATLYDLLTAYARERQKQALAHVRFAKRTVWSLVEAREALERMIGADRRLGAARPVPDRLCGRSEDARDCDGLKPRRDARTRARRPDSNCHQHAAFAPIYLRKRSGAEPDMPRRQYWSRRD